MDEVAEVTKALGQRPVHERVIDVLVEVDEPVSEACQRAKALAEVGVQHAILLENRERVAKSFGVRQRDDAITWLARSMVI